MATTNNTSGLFSRVANFVRSTVPVVASADADEVAKPAEDSGQAIKRVLERKAHNDSVRQREFAKLRKLRQVSAKEAVKLVARDSFFFESSSFPLFKEHASTLKKIDEIEAQMSRQWWKKQQDGTAIESPQQPMPVTEHGAQSAASEDETLMSFAATQPTCFGVADDGNLLGAGAQGGLQGKAKPDSAMGSKAQTLPPRSFELTGHSVFSASRMMSVDMGQMLSDPTLEDAAIRFANGDDVGAETVLLESIRAIHVQPSVAGIWAAALFDLYRGTGQQQRFDLFALDYAQRFGRTAPVWFSTSAAPECAAGSGLLPDAQQVDGGWICPAVLNQTALAGLDKVLRARPDQIWLDWRPMQSVPPELVAQLADCLHRCCEAPVLLQLRGEGVLAQVLRAQTPVGNRGVDPAWWRARLNMLCVLGEQHEFEAVSMDYCITYEVSPPPWRPANSRRTRGPLQADHGSACIVTQPQAMDAAEQAELMGDLKGDMTQRLRDLPVLGATALPLRVMCERLIRVDFAAAGSILNWAAARHAIGQQTEFVQVPRLVAVFFSLIGINEHARILVRAN